MNSNDALKLLVKYALSPMKMGACGRPESEELFRKFLETGINEGEVRSEIEKYFLTITPNLKSIAKTYGFGNPFDPIVIEIYIFGNSTIDENKSSGLDNLVDELQKVAAPKYLEKLIATKPATYIPLHTWFVIWSANAKNYDDFTFQKEVSSCMVSWGSVKNVSTEENDAVVEKSILKKRDGDITLFEHETLVSYDETLTAIPNVGDTVAIHRGCIFEIISQNQFENLKKYTQLTINAYNKKVNS